MAADWQTVLIIIGAFAGVEFIGAAVSLATAGQVDIHNIPYDCSPERLVCPNTGFVNATKRQCNIFGCYDEPVQQQFTGYFSYEYVQKWDTDYGSSYVPIFSEATGYEGTKHLCILNINTVNDQGQSAWLVGGNVQVNVTVGSLQHTFEFYPVDPALGQIAYGGALGEGQDDIRFATGIYHTGCYASKNAIGNNSAMYSGIMTDRQECTDKGKKEILHALEAAAWFPEGQTKCKRLNFFFFPILLAALIVLPTIFQYYSATGVNHMH